MIAQALRGAAVIIFGGIIGLLGWGLALALSGDTVQLAGDRIPLEDTSVPESATPEPRSPTPIASPTPEVLSETVISPSKAASLDSPAPTDEADLNQTLDWLIHAAPTWNRGVEASIAVSVGGELYTSGSDAQVNSASAAKAIWLAAASVIAGPDVTSVDAEAMIGLSDNEAAARVIGTVGVDPINGFTRAMGLGDTHLAGWPFVSNLRSRTYGAGDRLNLTTTIDLVTFYDAIAEGTVLGDDRDDIFEMLKLAPDRKTDGDGSELSVYGAVLTDRLPLAVAEATAHKSGWLPPQCCVSPTVLLITAGSVPIPPLTTGSGNTASGERYSVAISMSEGTNFAGSVEFISYASCVVFEAVTGIGRGCPAPTPTEVDR